MTEASRAERRPVRVAMAWAVHGLTASGCVAGLLALVAIGDAAWVRAFVWMGVAVFIDGIDGTLARRCQVGVMTPSFDGALLDNLADYLNYVVVPALFVHESAIMPPGWGWMMPAAMLVASGYQFCQRDAKTADHYFKGFPSYWNVVAFYLFFLGLPPWANVGIVAILVAGVFVPIRYLYPSRTAVLRRTTLMLSVCWGVLIAVVLAQYPEPDPVWIYLSLGYVVYYLAVSVFVTAAARPPARGGTRRAGW